MSCRLTLALAGALAIFVLPMTSMADEDARNRMLELSDIAAESVTGGEFEIGAIQFRQAYDIYPDPILLNNEMIAWFRADDCSNSLRAAYNFLQTDDVEDDDLRTVETVQRTCHLRLAETAVEEQNPHLATYHLEQLSGFELDDEHQDSYDSLRATVDEIPALDSDDEFGTLSMDGSSGSQTLHWAQISGGVALVGVGAVLHSVALDRQSQLRTLADSDDAGDALRFQQKQQEWGSFQRTTRWAVPTFYALGALSVGSGIFLLFRERSDSEQLSMAPSLSTQGVGLSLSGRF